MTRRAAYHILRGGLNLSDYAAMKATQSPELKTLWWSEGMLRSRPGQVRLTAGTARGIAAFGEDFWGWGFFHIGENICCADLSAPAPVYHTLYEGAGTEEGTFFRWGDCLYYKTDGQFLRIACISGDVPFAADCAALFAQQNVAVGGVGVNYNTCHLRSFCKSLCQ